MIVHLPDCDHAALYRCSLCGAVGDYDFGSYVELESCPYYAYACPECQEQDGVTVAPDSVQKQLRLSDADVPPEIDIFAGDILSMYAESGRVEFDENGNITPDSPMSQRDMLNLEERLLSLKVLSAPSERPLPEFQDDLFP